MKEFQALLGVLLAAVGLAAVARRVGAPYPALLALGGAILAFVAGAPAFTIPPDLALALFVAPVLLDAAFEASPRDLRDNWVPLTSLAVVSVVLTAMAVAVVVRAMVPAMPWAAAIALGAIVSPPDAAAATAVLRQLRPPHRILTILEGESLLNDATALLIYRLAVGAVAANAFLVSAVAPTFLLAVGGSIVVGPTLAWLLSRLLMHVRDVPTSIILQFISTFGVWILAERLGLSPVLTMASFAVAGARRAPERAPASQRIPSQAVWETAVFLLNVLAFAFIGLQIRPILTSLDPSSKTLYLQVAGAVLVTVILVRIAWVMTHTSVARRQFRRFGIRWRRLNQAPTLRSGLVVSWSGMRGIVTLAAALALPTNVSGNAFPFRDLIVLTSFSVVLGTLVLQGLTLRPLLQALDLQDDDPVGREVETARQRALRAALLALDGESSADAEAVRLEFVAHLQSGTDRAGDRYTYVSVYHEARHRALVAARRVILDMRARDHIGDAAFHLLEEEFDRIEMVSEPRVS